MFSGLPALAAIEAVPTDSKDKPSEDIVLVKATVFSNPVDEMEDELEKELQIKIDEREVGAAAATSQSLANQITNQPNNQPTVNG